MTASCVCVLFFFFQEGEAKYGLLSKEAAPSGQGFCFAH